MKKIVITLIILAFFSFNGETQEVVWHTDIEKALDVAKKENKNMLLFFTGSDWCGWCIRLQKEVFKTSDFETWSDSVVLVELDFPRKTPQDDKIRGQNQQLQSLFKVRGYPTVFFVSPETMADGRTNLKSLGKTGYVRGGAKKWLDVANNIVGNDM
ncbi:thioredoxin family protein [uncultured Algibacter sp.]|uniref:thioredoxin family protein n=1 Tax=uncultured Algibacter sp. TaxID=298659 RepID=UPI00262C7959|nr:thioredoxin family protein [uncultured Algibacter sp.]